MKNFTQGLDVNTAFGLMHRGATSRHGSAGGEQAYLKPPVLWEQAAGLP